MKFKKKVINVLGTKWTIYREEFTSDKLDGYTDYTVREIHIRSNNLNDVSDFDALMKKQLRHEVIHAFMAESGLQSNWEHYNTYGHEETVVDWIAIQFSKILKVYEELECL